MTQAQPLIQTLPMTLGAPMSDDPSNPTAIEIPLQIELPNGQTLFAAVALGGLPFDGQRQIAERMAAAWNAFAGVATQEIQAPVKCLHQIAEPPTQVVDAAPSLGDAWKTLLLDGSPLERDRYGCGYHPALPNFDEGVNGRKFFAVFGIELKASMAENEMESDAYESMTEGGPNYNVWNPERPKGEGWHLVAIFDTEDGPACWWLREVSVTDAKYLDDLAVDDLASLMKEKLAKQREKGYGGWNKKRQCTQQHLSNLLREHVGKGDPVDVANFCAMLSARGEAIAAAPQAVQATEEMRVCNSEECGWIGPLSETYGYKISPATLCPECKETTELSAPAHPAEGGPHGQ